jgi:hypothetical protein
VRAQDKYKTIQMHPKYRGAAIICDPGINSARESVTK